MTKRRRVPALLAALAVCGLLWLKPSLPGSDRLVLAAVEADGVSALTGRAPAATPELWERLKAMGVSAVILEEDSVAELAARGELLHFSRAEVEKWRALGLTSTGAGPRPDSLWAKDPRAFARLTAALGARGIDASTAAVAGGRAADLPPGVDLTRVPAGFDPETVAAVSAAGLLPVARPDGPTAAVAGHEMWIRRLPASSRTPQLLRACYGRSRRLLVLTLDPALGLESNLERLRAALKTTRLAGADAALPPAPPAAPERGRPLRLALWFAAGLLGPLLAGRAALKAERAAHAWAQARAPLSSPVPEVAAGLFAAWLAASAAGLAASMLPPAAARESWARAWTLWTLGAPLVVGAAALFALEGAKLRARWRAPVRVKDVAALACVALAASLLLAPRASLRFAGLWESIDRLSAAADLLWWWPWRWREILIGAPSLAVALALVDAREPGCETCGPKLLGDPKGWLLLGLVAPAGTVAAVGIGAAPATAAAHGAAAFAIGGVLGLGLAALRTKAEAAVWAERPKSEQVY